ncbi:hypothetical protein JCM6882_001509 [Rhodosporidiobolus microsporus]
MVKRESLSPPPPRITHPAPLSLDHDELDCLPALSLPQPHAPAPKRASPSTARLPPAKRKRDEAPTSPGRVIAAADKAKGRNRSAAAMQTPSASPQNSAAAARGQRRVGSERDGRREEQGIASGSRSAASRSRPGSSSSRHDAPAATPTKPSPRRTAALVFKSTPSSSGGERGERARLRAEQAEAVQQERTERRRHEQAEEEEEEPPGKESRAETALRRRKLVRGQGQAPPEVEVVVKAEPGLSEDEVEHEEERFSPPRARPQPRPRGARPDAAAVLPSSPSHPSFSNSSPRRRRPPPAPLPNTSSFSSTSASSLHAPPSPLPAPAASPSSTTLSSSTHHPHPPTLSSFLSSLPLPSLPRLTPHFHALGLSTPSDLLQLANGATEGARRARGRVLERVGKAAAEKGQAGLTEWERIVLEEELEEGWKRWKPQVGA